MAGPVGPEVIGAAKWLQINSAASQPYFLSSVGGGAFLGSLKPSQTSSIQYDTIFWCVDSQIVFSLGQSGLANVTPLANLPTPPGSPRARYGDIDDYSTSDGDGRWTNTLGDNLSNPSSWQYNTSLIRYRMAAWLISQYSGMPAGGPTVKDARDVAIQRAIWAIIHNSVGGDITGYSSISGTVGDPTTVRHWVEEAKKAANYNTIDLSRWAVVSWVVSANGALLEDDRQTFLVQIVPEPGFYGLLGLGLSALLFFARRRQTAA
jgi:hypothetical protein